MEQGGPADPDCERCGGAGEIFEDAKKRGMVRLRKSENGSTHGVSTSDKTKIAQLKKDEYKVIKEDNLNESTGSEMVKTHPHIKSEKEFIDILADRLQYRFSKAEIRGLWRDEDFIPDMMDDYKFSGGKLTDPGHMKAEATEATVWDAMDHDKDESPESPKQDSPKVKVPSNVKTSLKKEIKELRVAAKSIEKTDEMRAEFYNNSANAMEAILNHLNTGTLEGMKLAQIFMTKLMSPIVQRIPDAAYDFVSTGGEPKTLKDLFKEVKVKK